MPSGANQPVQGGEAFHLGDAVRPERDLGPLALLQKRYLAQTLILWGTCFLSLGNIALLQNWMATFFQEIGGIPIQEFAISAMISFAGGAVGTLIMGFLMDRMNPYWLIAVFYFVEAIALYTLGSVPFSSGIFLGALIMWNFTQVGGQTGLNNLATLELPARNALERDRLGRGLGPYFRHGHGAVRRGDGAANDAAARHHHGDRCRDRGCRRIRRDPARDRGAGAISEEGRGGSALNRSPGGDG